MRDTDGGHAYKNGILKVGVWGLAWNASSQSIEQIDAELIEFDCELIDL